MGISDAAFAELRARTTGDPTATRQKPDSGRTTWAEGLERANARARAARGKSPAAPGRRAKGPPVPTEAEEHAAVVAALGAAGLRFFHPPNGGKRGGREAAEFQRMGVQPGVPDLFILDPPPAHPGAPGMVVEMKRRKAAPSAVTEHQREWLDALAARGWVTCVARGADEALAALRAAGYLVGGP